MVVVIEQQDTPVNNNPSSNPNSTSTQTPSYSSPVTAAATANDSANDSDDGYETASDRHVSDHEEDDDNTREIKNDDDESEQKALAEANNAKLEGNKLFGEGRYEDALLQYEVALQAAPDGDSSADLRSICYSNRGVCFFKLGKYEDTVKECTKAIDLNPSYMKALSRRGEAYEKLEKFDEAIADMKKILELDLSNDGAKRAIRRLEPLAEEKREKMKEEMLAKLKEMGNSLLGRFGMSVDNFKAVKDPNTGSYSISFQR